MVTGQVPFKAENPVGIAVKHLTETPQRPRELNPAITPGLEAIILKALSKEEDKRYQTADDMYRDLDGLGFRPAVSPKSPIIVPLPIRDSPAEDDFPH